MRKYSFVFLLVLVVLISASCAGKVRTIVINDDDPEHIWLQYQIDQNDQIVSQGFSHPAKLSPQQVYELLKAVRYEEYTFMAWRKKGGAFNDAELKKLATPISEALVKATADQWIHFATTGMKREMIFETRHLTDGICYVKDGKFNIVLGNMNIELISPDQELYKRDPRDMLYTESLRLELNPESGVNAPPVVDGDPWLSKPRRNWLMIDLAEFFTHVDLQVTPVEATPEPVDQSDTTVRLQKLKELLDAGLITQEEYDQKRKEILGDL